MIKGATFLSQIFNKHRILTRLANIQDWKHLREGDCPIYCWWTESSPRIPRVATTNKFGGIVCRESLTENGGRAPFATRIYWQCASNTCCWGAFHYRNWRSKGQTHQDFNNNKWQARPRRSLARRLSYRSLGLGMRSQIRWRTLILYFILNILAKWLPHSACTFTIKGPFENKKFLIDLNIVIDDCINRSFQQCFKYPTAVVSRASHKSLKALPMLMNKATLVHEFYL